MKHKTDRSCNRITPRLLSPRGLWRLTLCALTLSFGLTLWSAPRDAAAIPDTITITLYTADGTTDVSALFTYTNHHVYDPDGYPVGTVGDDGQIYNDSNQAIGCVTVDPSTTRTP